MNRLANIVSTSIGKKAIAAVTGIVLFLFLVGHVTGNLKVFAGQEANKVPSIDEYAHFLRVLGHPILPPGFGLWGARIFLLLCLVAHVVVVALLALQNKRARPIKYAKSTKVASTWAAQWMMYSGLLILGFVVFHILHFTTGTIQIGKFTYGTVYANLFASFKLWPVATVYVVAVIVMGVHLYHGVWSLFQTLGLDNPDRNRILRQFAMVMTVLIVVGFCVVPIAFAVGLMATPTEYPKELLEGK